MDDQPAPVETDGCLWSLAPRWKPPDRLVAISERVGVVASPEPVDDDTGFNLHVRVLADRPVTVMLEPLARSRYLSGRFGLVDPVAGRWFQRVADATYRILVFAPGLTTASPPVGAAEQPGTRDFPLRSPAAVDTVLPTAAAAGDTALHQWRHLYEDADSNVQVEVLGGGRGSGTLTVAARSAQASDALSMVRISLDRGLTPYLIPLAPSGEDCRGEIVVADPKAIRPTVEVGLWCFDLGPDDHDCIVRSIGATRRGRTRRAWSEIAHHAARNGLDALERDIRAALDAGPVPNPAE